MSTTKKIDNIKFDEGKTDGTIKDYADLLLLAIDTPPTERGFSPAENVEATRLYKLISERKDDTVIELKMKDFAGVLKAFNGGVRVMKRSTEVAEMTEYLDAL